MTVALIVLGVVAYLTAYLCVGWRLMKWDMPALWERARKSNGIGVSGKFHDELFEKFVISEAHSGAVSTLLFWPIRLPFLLAMAVADRMDPKRVEEQIRQNEARIAELERELQIKRRP